MFFDEFSPVQFYAELPKFSISWIIHNYYLTDNIPKGLLTPYDLFLFHILIRCTWVYSVFLHCVIQPAASVSQMAYDYPVNSNPQWTNNFMLTAENHKFVNPAFSFFFFLKTLKGKPVTFIVSVRINYDHCSIPDHMQSNSYKSSNLFTISNN